MPKVKILRTVPIAEDGIHVRLFREKSVMEVSDKLYKIMLSLSAAELIPTESRRTSPAPSEGTTTLTPSETKTTVAGLSDELGISSKRIIQTCKELKIAAKDIDSALSAEDVSKIKSKFEKPK